MLGKILLKECWNKDSKAIGLGTLPLSMYHVKIAADAERIVFSAWNQLHIFNFDGVRERSIIAEKPISNMAVTSDCSRIFVWIPGRVRGDIVAYNPEGSIELEVKAAAMTEKGTLESSLDGRLFAAKGDEYFDVWDSKGNWLCGQRSAWGGAPLLIFSILAGRGKFPSLDIAPDGSYIACSTGGGGTSGGAVAIMRTPNTDDLLKLSDLRQRTAAWESNLEDLQMSGWWDSTVCAANNRLVLWKGRSICIFDIMHNKCSELLSQELVGSPENVEWVEMTCDGKYLYFATKHKKVTSLNIFDVDNKTIIRGLSEFPEGTSVSLSLSHDGRKLVAIVERERLLSRSLTISMLSVQ